MPAFLVQKWPLLETLQLSLNVIEDEAISDLVNADLSCLLSLTLRRISADISQLASANWQLLQTLDLSQHYRSLSTADISALSGGQWPQLRCLHLVGAGVGAANAACLVRGQWPQLEILNLSRTYIDEACMTALVTGDWPVLNRLSIVRSHVTSIAVSVLLKRGWATLERLDMPTKHVLPEIWEVYPKLLGGASLKPGLNQLDSRQGHAAFQSRLVQLKELNFCDGWQAFSDTHVLF
ncbi:hypothetical protein ABBQ32_005269 [Trebouxia sp. C0010 RCD-2024]